ncbi:hypothetical protein GCM10023115_40040 [Pontixanthobacter gangjinensis]
MLITGLRCEGQEVVFIKSGENGNGILQQRFEECYIITPQHVVASGMGKIQVIDRNSYELTAEHKKSFQPDLALLKVLDDPGLKCPEWETEKDINNILQNSSSGFIEYRDEVGKKSLIHVSIVEINQNFIRVSPVEPEEKFIKGNSGAAFFVKYKGKRLLAGMLISISEEARIGNVAQIDDIERSLSGFFFEHTEKPRLGIMILDEEGEFSPITNIISSSLDKSSKYTPVTPIPDSDYFKDKLVDIFEGKSQELPNSTENELQEIMLGKLSFETEKTPNNMFLVRVNLDGRLYQTTEFRLLSDLSLEAKAIALDQEKARRESLKYLAKKLEKELN